jgi:hypothetical protein
MGRFDGIEDTKVYKTGQYFKPGKYRVKINNVKWVKASVGSKEFAVIETEVLESSNPEVPVGGERSHVIDMGGVMGMPTFKAFVAAASGVDPSVNSINEDVEKYWAGVTGNHLAYPKICEMLCPEDGVSPLEDEVMDLECVEIKKKDGDPFTKHNWGVREISAA